MMRFVIVDGLPYLLSHGKTYAVRFDEKGFTVGMEVELASIPSVTYSALSVLAKCAGHLDSISVPEPEQEEDQQNETETEPEQEETQIDLADMTVPELKAYAEANGISLGNAKKKADIVKAIKDVES